MNGYYILIFLVMGASWLVQQMLRSRFAKYSRVPMNMTGKEVAEQMLADNGLHDVKVISVRGQLTDHYNPQTRTVNLSEAVYNQTNVAAAAVAAHECGHAVQHATAYPALQMRSRLVPIVSASSRWMQYVLLAGFVMFAAGNSLLLWIGVFMFGLTTLFSLVTLPVEFDASKRALVWLNATGIASGQKQAGARDALKWAAMTYVVAALGSLAQLIYFLNVLNSRD